MQYSLRTIMVVTALVAVMVVLPSQWLGVAWSIVWHFVPAALVTLAYYGRDEVRAFGIASSATHFSLAMSGSGFSLWGPLHLIQVAGAGLIGALLMRRLASSPPTQSEAPT